MTLTKVKSQHQAKHEYTLLYTYYPDSLTYYSWVHTVMYNSDVYTRYWAHLCSLCYSLDYMYLVLELQLLGLHATKVMIQSFSLSTRLFYKIHGTSIRTVEQELCTCNYHEVPDRCWKSKLLCQTTACRETGVQLYIDTWLCSSTPVSSNS